MERTIKMYDLLLSCPGDAYNECYPAVKDAIDKFNNDAQTTSLIGISLKHWSTDSYPQSGGKAQQLLNSQIVDCADVAIAIFWTRFGTPTDEYGSGTEEEIDRFMKSKKQVFLYFLDKLIPPSITDTLDYIENRRKISQLKDKYNGIYSIVKDETELKEKIIENLKKYFLNNNLKDSQMVNRWFRSDTGKEIASNELLKCNNTIAQIDGNIARVEVNKPDGTTMYAEINIDNQEVSNIVADGFPQEYTIDIPKNLIVNKKQNIILIDGITYRFEKFTLKFGGYLSVTYDNATSKIQNINAQAPAGMKVVVDTTNKTVCIVNESKF